MPLCPNLSITGSNIDSDPTGETGIEFLLPSPKVWDLGQDVTKTVTEL